MAQRGGLSEYDVRFGEEERRERPGADTPFRILVLGDFGGRRPLAQPWRPLLTDRDNFDEVMRRAGVELRLPWPDASESALSMEGLDAFHPDALYERLPALGRLRTLRAGVADPARHPDAAREARALLGLADPADAGPAQDRPASGAEWLAGLLGESPRAQNADPIEQMLRRLSQQYAVAPPPADQAQLLARLDDTASATLRELLHHPRFQALEAAWRGLKMITHRLDTGAELKVYALDLTRDELAADLAAGGEGSRLHKLLAEPESEPWAVAVGLYSFGPTETDVEDLLKLARIARTAGAPFLAAAADRVAGCDSLPATPDPDDWRIDESDPGIRAWQALRAQTESQWLGLALPRVLLRLPYGRKTDPCERFDFEEVPGAPLHEHYLWGSPAVVCALLLGRSFGRGGWEMGASLEQELDGLPLHNYRDGGESQVKPCAELALRERALERLLDAGLLVLVSPRGEDRAVVARWQSLASPLVRLAGPWTRRG
jgi:type VI secretion system protein ImpC